MAKRQRYQYFHTRHLAVRTGTSAQSWAPATSTVVLSRYVALASQSGRKMPTGNVIGVQELVAGV
eukprot:scaffold101_cov373-Prasinococcus_capsulatus_cf.AAC.20